MIEAIQTRYAGYHFRSRLEARWAVWFTALGIPWEYEREGYALPSGPYLPDFWISNPMPEWPEAGYWIDIKPSNLPNDNEAFAKIADLTMATKHTGYIVAGDPGNFRTASFNFNTRKWTFATKNDLRDYSPSNRPLWFASLFAHSLTHEMKPNILEAITAARSARFEHGETPRRHT